jgi:Cft2 family RNA processing exonuclease
LEYATFAERAILDCVKGGWYAQLNGYSKRVFKAPKTLALGRVPDTGKISVHSPIDSCGFEIPEVAG